MPTLVTPPKLLNSALELANGMIVSRVTAPFAVGTDVAVRVAARGVVLNGEFKNEAGTGAFVLPATPSGYAVEIWLILNEWRDGRAQTVTSSRTVSVLDQATVTWNDLVDVAPGVAPGDYLVPSWVASTLAARDTAVTSADTATTKAAEAAASAASIVGQRGVANGYASLDGTALLPEAQVPTRLTEAVQSATFAQRWQPLTAYTLEQAVVNPSGDIVSAIAAHTSGASFTAANWNLSATRLTEAARGIAASRRSNSILRGSVATNEGHMYTGQFTTVPNCNSVKRFTLIRATTTVRLVYGNQFGIDVLTGLVSMTIRAAVDDGTTKTPVYFNGSRDGVVQPGGWLVSDPVTIPLAAGAFLWARTFVTPADALHIPYTGSTGAVTVSTWGEGCDASASVQTDKTLTGAVTGGYVSHYSPVAILANDDGAYPLVSINGDSIAVGIGDLQDIGVYGRGFARRALNNGFAFLQQAIAGSAMSHARALRRPLVAGCSTAICNSGANDVNTADTVATIQARYLAEWGFHSTLGARVFQTTITPRTTSTDSWATTTNQTVSSVAVNDKRVTLNNWIRDGAPILAGVAVAAGSSAGGTLRAGAVGHPLFGYFETADTVETARDSGIWKVGYVYITDAQGVHPNDTGHAAMAAAINTTLIG